MFPTVEKYVDHVHIINGVEARVINKIAQELENKFHKLMALYNQGKKVIFTNISDDLEILYKELNY